MRALRHSQVVWRVRKALKDAGLDVKSQDVGSNEGDCTRLTTQSGDTYFTVDVQESIMEPFEEEY